MSTTCSPAGQNHPIGRMLGARGFEQRFRECPTSSALSLLLLCFNWASSTANHRLLLDVLQNAASNRCSHLTLKASVR